MAEYELIYHAGIPGRGEFIRLLFEASATPYHDSALNEGQAAIKPYLDGSFEGNDENPTPFAPPILKHGQVVVSQTSNILLYLATHLENPIDLSPPATRSSSEPSPAKKAKPSRDDTTLATHLFHVNSLALTILDLNNEAHDTHHPISVASYYEDQRDAAVDKAKDFRANRVPKFFAYFENLLGRDGAQEWLVGTTASYADLCLFQVVDGLKFAFPNLLANELPKRPNLMRHYERVQSADRIQKYLESERRQKYSMGVFRYYEELDEPKA